MVATTTGRAPRAMMLLARRGATVTTTAVAGAALSAAGRGRVASTNSASVFVDRAPRTIPSRKTLGTLASVALSAAGRAPRAAMLDVASVALSAAGRAASPNSASVSVDRAPRTTADPWTELVDGGVVVGSVAGAVAREAYRIIQGTRAPPLGGFET